MSKPTLLLLHGALGASVSFEDLKTRLSDDFELIMPDLKWHGARAASGNAFSMGDLVDDLENQLKEMGDEPLWVFGYSMGGYVAMSLALRQPKYFKGIMSLGTKLDWSQEQAKRESAMLNADKIEEKVPKFAHKLQQLHGENWKALCGQTAQMMLDLGNNPILTTENMKQLEIPVRLGLGDKDNMVSLEETVAFYKSLTHGELQVFPSTQHPLERVDLGQLAAAIKEFIKTA